MLLASSAVGASTLRARVLRSQTQGWQGYDITAEADLYRGMFA